MPAPRPAAGRTLPRAHRCVHSRAMQRVRFMSEGSFCVGDLRLPEGPGPHPAVVVCCGMSLTKEVWMPPYAEALTAAGYATLCFDYRGFGESEGARLRLVPSAQVSDVRNALTYLETRTDIASSQLGLLGISLGCSVAVAAAAADERARVTIGVAGPADLGRVWGAFPGFEGFRSKVWAARKRYVETGETRTIRVSRLLAGDPETAAKIEADAPAHPTWEPEVTFESLLDLFEFVPEREVHRIAPRKLLLVTPEHDPVIAGDELRSMAAKAGPTAELLVLAGARHSDVYGRARDVVVEAALQALAAGF